MRLLTAFLCVQACWAGFSKVVSVTFNHLKIPSSLTYQNFVCANGTSTTNCDAVAHTNLSVPQLKGTGSGGVVTSASGYDAVWFSFANCTNPLPFELVPGTYSATSGFAEFYVTIARSSSVDDVVYLCMGNSAITTYQGTTSTWSSDFLAVHHYPNGSSLTVLDSTSNANDGTITGGVTASAGNSDGAADFNGTTGYITDSTLSFTGGVSTSATWEAWIYPTANNTVIAYGDGGSDHTAPYFFLNTDNVIWVNPSPLNDPTKTNEAVSLNAWTYLVWVNDFSGIQHNHIYINGVEATYSTLGGDGTPLHSITGWQIGAYGLTQTLKWTGKLDELRFSTTARSTSYITATYNNLSSPWTFYTFGTPSGVSNPVSSTRRTIEFR